MLKEMTVTESREIRKANACEASSHDNSYMEQCLRQFMEVCGDGNRLSKASHNRLKKCGSGQMTTRTAVFWVVPVM